MIRRCWFEGGGLRISLLVQGSPHATQALANALGFAEAAVAAGHGVERVFFYKDAVVVGSRLAVDEAGLRQRWQALAGRAGFELAVCVAAAERRGIVDDSLAAGFATVGLGQLVQAMEASDRLVTF